MADFSPCLAFTRQEEGGFVDDPDDPGGATNMGITIATLSAWRGRPCSVQDVQSLGVAEAKAIYAAKYWNVVRGSDLPAGVDLMVFDFGVNAGPARSAKMLQNAVATDPDGFVGDLTVAATAKRSPLLVITALAQAQDAYYRGLPTFPKFGRGWLNRLARRRATATGMIAPAIVAPPAAAPAPHGWLATLAGIFTRKAA